MIYFIPIIAWLIFIFAPWSRMLSFGVSNDMLINSYCYMVAHASLAHLIVNTLSLFMLWFPIRKLYILRYNTNSQMLSFASYVAALLAGLFCATTIPTVGMSGMVFFLLGVLLVLNPTKRQLLNYIWVVLTVIVQIFFGHSNVALHIFAFMEGIIFMCVREFLYQYKNGTGLFGPKENEKDS